MTAWSSEALARVRSFPADGDQVLLQVGVRADRGADVETIVDGDRSGKNRIAGSILCEQIEPIR